MSDVMRAVVMDGVTVGRPCCKVHDCQGHLPSQRALFCSQHIHLSTVCVVDGCDSQARPGFRTCPEKSHSNLEDIVGHSALFQLCGRLEHLKVLPENMEGGHSVLDEMLEVDENGECPEKLDTGNSKPRARFGRRRTHNEQLCVATCGVILGRATFFGSEAINGARVHSSFSLGLTG